MKRWFVYVIANDRNETYTGITFDVTPDRRIAEHNAGGAKAARFTRGRGPWRLVYSEAAFATRAAAQAREHALRHDRRLKRQLKTASGRSG